MSVDLEELTKEELYEIAQERDIPGRSTMSKEELIEAIQADEAAKSPTPESEPVEENPEQAVSFTEYQRVIEENQRLRSELQIRIQGAVGAPQTGALSP